MSISIVGKLKLNKKYVAIMPIQHNTTFIFII